MQGEQLTLPVTTAPVRYTGPSIMSARPVIAGLRAEGATWAGIARTLNARGVPTPTGRGRWWGESVARHANPDAWAAYMRHYRAHSYRRAG